MSLSEERLMEIRKEAEKAVNADGSVHFGDCNTDAMWFVWGAIPYAEKWEATLTDRDKWQSDAESLAEKLDLVTQDLNRLTNGMWSVELARLSRLNMELREERNLWRNRANEGRINYVNQLAEEATRFKEALRNIRDEKIVGPHENGSPIYNKMLIASLRNIAIEALEQE